jgi:organic hydroperoxide reductase OsmC/OhrA
MLSAIQLAARQSGKKEMASKAVVHASVHIGEPNDIGGFGLAVDLKVEGVDDEVLKAGHEVRHHSCTIPKVKLLKLSWRFVHIAVHSDTV